MELIPIVEQIKKQEEEKYNIQFELETPTVIEYFKDNFQGKNFSLSESISTLIIGLGSVGITDSDNRKICIFKKHEGIYKHFKKSLKYRLNEAMLAYATFHEVRHILQSDREDLFTGYELFCINFLPIMNNKYLINTEFHDSQYFEIDANIYGALETKKMFSQDKQVSKYFDEILSDHLYEKCTHNFEYFFNKFLKTIKEGFEEEYYNNNLFIKTFWNIDGSFKTVKEIMSANNQYDTKLSTKIITSNDYLSSVNINDLQTLELKFLADKLNEAIAYLTEDMNKIHELYANKMIPKIDYQIGVNFVEKQIENKQRFINEMYDSNKNNKPKVLKRLFK